MSNDPKAKDATPELDVTAVTTPTPEPTAPLVTNPPDLTPAPAPDVEDAVLSDGHCPLVVGEVSAQSKARVTENIEGTKIVRREPVVELQDPTACPNCGKFFERHALVSNMYGEKDCAVAMNAKLRPEFKPYFDVANAGDAKAAKAEAAKLGKHGESLQRVFSPEAQKAKA